MRSTAHAPGDGAQTDLSSVVFSDETTAADKNRNIKWLCVIEKVLQLIISAEFSLREPLASVQTELTG